MLDVENPTEELEKIWKWWLHLQLYEIKWSNTYVLLLVLPCVSNYVVYKN